jgi:hypothetical protein
MSALTLPTSGRAGAVVLAGSPARCHPPVTGGGLPPLAMSLRARGLCGRDVLRRSQDRAPPVRS